MQRVCAGGAAGAVLLSLCVTYALIIDAVSDGGPQCHNVPEPPDPEVSDHQNVAGLLWLYTIVITEFNDVLCSPFRHRYLPGACPHASQAARPAVQSSKLPGRHSPCSNVQP